MCSRAPGLPCGAERYSRVFLFAVVWRRKGPGPRHRKGLGPGPPRSRDALRLARSSSRALQKWQNYLKCLRCSDGEHRFHLKVGAAGVRPAATSIRAPSCSWLQAHCSGGASPQILGRNSPRGFELVFQAHRFWAGFLFWFLNATFKRVYCPTA